MVSGASLVGGSSLVGGVDGDGFSGCWGWCSRGSDGGDGDDDGFSGCCCGVGGDGVGFSIVGLLGVRL